MEAAPNICPSLRRRRPAGTVSGRTGTLAGTSLLGAAKTYGGVEVPWCSIRSRPVHPASCVRQKSSQPISIAVEMGRGADMERIRQTTTYNIHYYKKNILHYYYYILLYILYIILLLYYILYIYYYYYYYYKLLLLLFIIK